MTQGKRVSLSEDGRVIQPGKRTWESTAVINVLVGLRPDEHLTFAELRSKSGIPASLSHSHFLAVVRSARKHLLEQKNMLFDLTKTPGIVRIDDGRVIDMANRRRKSIYKSTRVMAMQVCAADASKLSSHEAQLQKAILSQSGLVQAALSDSSVKAIAESNKRLS